jgi:NADH:ubiquinone oxidoreductase subunit 5 (subunit L)/multisubunit Na+/H+ antiporter MnhA subunit
LPALAIARSGSTAAKLLTTGALFVSCALSWPIFLGFIAGTETSQLHHVLTWIHSGDLRVDWALRVDALTAVMLVVITTVSALVTSTAGATWPRIRTSPASSPICRCSPSRC